jgi:hypothetical protein
MKQVQQNDESSSSFSEDEDDGANFKKIDDMALFMKNYHKGLNRSEYIVVPRKSPNKEKRELATIVEALSISLPSVIKKRRTITTRRTTTKRANMNTRRGTILRETHTSDMNGTQLMSQVKRMIRLQLCLFKSHPLHQGSSTI